MVDLLHRINTMGNLFQSDADIMRELEETQLLIEQEKEILEQKKQALTNQQNELTSQQNALEEQRASLEAQQDALEEEQASLESMQSEKNSSLNTLESNLSQVQGDIATTNARIQEAARILEEQRAAQAAREEAERRAAEAARERALAQAQAQESATNNRADNNNNTSNNNNSNNGNSSSTGQFNGRFVFPVNAGRITSPFGPRIHPVTGRQSFHRGIDIVSSTPNAPIHAIADGVVVFSGWASGYGNYIVIQHDATTFSGYGHNRVNQVRVGDRVTAGQQIAIMGTTGVSTGVHLHLNIMMNTTNFWSGHVNPAPLLGR